MAIFKVVTSFFSRYATAFKYGAVIVLLLTIGYAVYDYSKLRERTAVYEQKNDELITTIEAVKEDLVTSNKNIQALRSKNLDIEIKYNEALDKIDAIESLTYQDIEENKPLIEQQINKQYNDVRREMRCVTGDSSSC